MKSKSVPNLIHSESVFSMDNPFYIHRSVISSTLELHRHDFFEIDLIISGSGDSNINGESYLLSKGDIVFLSPSDHHNYVLEDNCSLKFINIAFPMGLISPRAMSVMPADVKVIHLSEKDYDCIKGVCDFMADKYDDKDANCPLLMKASIEWLLVFMSFVLELQQTNSGVDRDFSQVIVYINNNFSQEELSRASVAATMHMSPTHFSKKFHKTVGISFQEYLLNTRLNYANGMLKMTDMTVSEIAGMSGFGSESYFSKIFKKRFGISPGKVRRTGKG